MANPLQDTPLSGFTSGFFQNPDVNIPTTTTRLTDIITNLVTVLTVFAGLAFMLWFVVGALTWISAADHADKLEKAKAQMSSALVGLVIVILTFSVVYLIGKILGIDILNLTDIIPKLAPD